MGNNRFVLCPKCGTKNFSDDIVCGICNSSLAGSNFAENRKSKPSKTSPLALVLIIILLIVGYSIMTKDSKSNSNSIDEIENSVVDASVWQVKEYLKSNLNDRGSYEQISWSAVLKLNDTKEIGFPCCQVRHKYRARNAYGAYVIEEKLFRLDYKGNVVSVNDFNR